MFPRNTYHPQVEANVLTLPPEAGLGWSQSTQLLPTPLPVSLEGQATTGDYLAAEPQALPAHSATVPTVHQENAA